MNKTLQYGKIITSDSYFNGKPTNRVVTYSIPIVVSVKSQVLSEIIKAIDLITSKQTYSVNLLIKAGKDHQLKMMVVEYAVESLDRIIS